MQKTRSGVCWPSREALCLNAARPPPTSSSSSRFSAERFVHRPRRLADRVQLYFARQDAPHRSLARPSQRVLAALEPIAVRVWTSSAALMLSGHLAAAPGARRSLRADARSVADPATEALIALASVIRARTHREPRIPHLVDTVAILLSGVIERRLTRQAAGLAESTFDDLARAALACAKVCPDDMPDPADPRAGDDRRPAARDKVHQRTATAAGALQRSRAREPATR